MRNHLWPENTEIAVQSDAVHAWVNIFWKTGQTIATYCIGAVESRLNSTGLDGEPGSFLYTQQTWRKPSITLRNLQQVVVSICSFLLFSHTFQKFIEKQIFLQSSITYCTEDMDSCLKKNQHTYHPHTHTPHPPNFTHAHISHSISCTCGCPSSHLIVSCSALIYCFISVNCISILLFYFNAPSNFFGNI